MKILLITLATVAVLWFAFAAVKGVCHECLTLPMAVVCEHSNDAVDTQMESNRIKGYIVERRFAGCVFYWHENNTGGN
jgi:hypothetical protein